MSTDLKLSKGQISKIMPSGKFLRSLLSKKMFQSHQELQLLLQKLIQEFKNKNKEKQGSGTTTSIISNEEMNDIMKIVQPLEDSNTLLKGVTKTMKKETEEQKRGFLSMLLGTLGTSLLGNLSTGKGIVRANSGNKKGKGIVRAGTGKQWDFQCCLIL